MGKGEQGCPTDRQRAEAIADNPSLVDTVLEVRLYELICSRPTGHGGVPLTTKDLLKAEHMHVSCCCSAVCAIMGCSALGVPSQLNVQSTYHNECIDQPSMIA